jgi:tetratricopeptide (TPR) repeat protein
MPYRRRTISETRDGRVKYRYHLGLITRKDSMKNRFSRVTTLIAGAGLIGLLTIGPVSPAFAQSKQQPSKAAAKPLKAAEEAIHAKKFDVAAAKIKEVQALPERSPYDEYLIHEMDAFLAFHNKDYAGAEKDLEANLNSPFAKQSEMPGHVKQLAVLNLNLKDYTKAIDFGTRAVKGGYADDSTYEILEQAYYLKGDHKATLHFVNDYVDTQIKAGKTPKERSLKTIMSTCIAMKDQGCETHAFERLVMYYPKGDYWSNLVNSLFSSDDYKADQPRLELFRLAFDVNVLKNPGDYTEMAQLDLDQRAAGESVRVLQKGIDGNVFTEPREKDKNGRLLAAAQKSATADQAALPQLTSDAAASPDGKKDAALGLTLLSYQQYPQAIEALNRALKKGGLQSPAETQLLTGIAQLKAGNKDEAVKAFHAVKGDPKFERLASLWALHARQA